MEEALEVAQKYYLHDVTMDVIARQKGTSRSTVSRLLRYARDAGLVEIRIMPPHSRSHQLRSVISDAFEVEVEIVPVPATATSVERLERTAIHTARFLNSVFESDMIIGVSWGTMVQAISRCLIAKQTTNSQFVQLNGTGFSRATGSHYSGAVMDAFGQAFDAYVWQFPVPVYFDSAETAAALLRERSMQRIVALQQRADAVLFSVGTVTGGVPSSPYLHGYYLDESDFRQLGEDGAVGDIATSYIGAAGSHGGIRMNSRTSGPDLDRLREVKYRICAVSGDHKIEAVVAALRGGYVSHLVIDEITATGLLEHLG
jgi:DNA-binding transcriptional regulator LsrR (DeoR family)